MPGYLRNSAALVLAIKVYAATHTVGRYKLQEDNFRPYLKGFLETAKGAMPVGRITVSLPDNLEADLDAYAKENKISVSGAVTRAIQAFLPGHSPAPPAVDLVDTQLYLSQALAQLEDLRSQLHRMAMAQYGPFAPIPDSLQQPLPTPPWSNIRFETEEEDDAG